MLFTKRVISIRDKGLTIKLNGDVIEEVDNIRFLGVIINNRLKWEKHINHIKDKAKKYVSILKAISSLNVGAHPKTLLTIYKGLIRATLDWGSMYYHDGAENDLIKIDRIQYAALRSLGCIITTPINVLLHLASEPALKYRRQFITKKYLARIIANSKNLLIPKLKLMKNTYEKSPHRGISFLNNIYRVWILCQEEWEGIETTSIPVNIYIHMI